MDKLTERAGPLPVEAELRNHRIDRMRVANYLQSSVNCGDTKVDIETIARLLDVTDYVYGR